ncbi:acyltransferase [Caballeronia sp. INML1]|uniref:acyltransferase family protein n=1 Tax=Caballeronia sp. INML1 TaxID=2921760 RepID=UPI002028A0D9|nr:acyltransferase [Caballeronia sp. INML1]
MKTVADKRIDDIEALRAIAVAITILDHLPHLFPWHISGVSHVLKWFNFWSGVDLFFAISGFVIARGLFGQLEAVKDSDTYWRNMIAFWIRRFYRIWPSSLLWMVVVVLLSAALRNTGLMMSVRSNFADLTAVVLQVANFHWAYCHAVNRAYCGDIGVWWSLSLEEQFYLAIPILMWVMRKRLPYFLGAVVLIQMFLDRPFLGPLWYVRTDSICFGVLLAYFERTTLYKDVKPVFMERRWIAIPLVGFSVVLLASLAQSFTDKPVIVPFTTGLIAAISAFLVFIGSYNNDYIVRSKALKPIVLWAGSRSYSIYLIHLPTIVMTKALWRFIEPSGTVFTGNYFLRFFFVWLAMTLILSELNYRLLEQPFRINGRDAPRRFRNGNAPVLSTGREAAKNVVMQD